MDATNRQRDARMQIADGSTQVIDDVYVLNGAICLHTFNYPMMKHGSLFVHQILKGWNEMEIGAEPIIIEMYDDFC